MQYCKLFAMLKKKHDSVCSIKRNDWRQDSILETVANNLLNFELNWNLRRYWWFRKHKCLFESCRLNEPNADIYRQLSNLAILERRRKTVIRLSCAFGTNFDKSQEFKSTRYKKLRDSLITPRTQLNLILFEMSEISEIFFRDF